MVTIENCRRKLGPGVAFSCDHFHASAGEHVALWGPSGCGKSTILNLISGLLRPDSGVLRIDGVEIQDMGEIALDQFRGQRFGFVFQTFNLLAPFTALQNVMLGMRFSDTIPEREWSKPGTMSVGEQQRVAIARALANKQKIVVADEPTGSLDPKTAGTVMDLLLEMCTEEKVTMLLVTHDRSIADSLPSQFDCSDLVHEVGE